MRRKPFKKFAFVKSQKGVSLIEILMGIVLLSLISICALSYFAYAVGGIGKQGNRRAALERARQRLEQLMAASLGSLPTLDPSDGQRYWCNGGDPCTSWTPSAAAVAQTISVDDLPTQRMETSVQWVDDPSAGTGNNDTLALSVKVWFTSDVTMDNNFNRVYVRTLRTP